MQGFLKKIKIAYPSLSGVVVTRAALEGMLPNKSRSIKDSEDVILQWINDYQEDIKATDFCVQALFNSAIERGYLVIAKVLLEFGANKQDALHLLKNKAAADLLLSNGGLSAMSKTGHDVRDKVYRSENDLYRMQEFGDVSIWEILIKGKYPTATDKKDVLSTIYKRELKTDVKNAKDMIQVAAKSISWLNEDLFKSFLNSAGKDIWDWRFDGGKTISMLLAEHGIFSFLGGHATKYKIENRENYVKATCDNGWSTLMYSLYYDSFYNYDGILRDNVNERKMSDSVGPTCLDIANVIRKLIIDNKALPDMESFNQSHNKNNKLFGVSLDGIVKELEKFSGVDKNLLPEILLNKLTRGELVRTDAEALTTAIIKEKDGNILLNSPAWMALWCTLRVLDTVAKTLEYDECDEFKGEVENAEVMIKKCHEFGIDPYEWLNKCIDMNENVTTLAILKIAERYSLMTSSGAKQGSKKIISAL